MSVDANLIAEAERLLRHFSTPARELVCDNKHGPLEARLAGAVVQLAKAAPAVVVHSEVAMPEDQLKAIEEDATERIEALATCLERAIEILAERCVGIDDLIVEAIDAIDAGRAEFNLDGGEISADDPIFVENATQSVQEEHPMPCPLNPDYGHPCTCGTRRAVSPMK